MRRLFVPTCTITVSSLPLFSISGTICSILPPGLHTVLSPAHCCCRFLPTCLTRESPTNNTLPFLWLVAAFSCLCSLSESFVVLLLLIPYPATSPSFFCPHTPSNLRSRSNTNANVFSTSFPP